jgi:SAM-dependent methyltransferase
LNTQDNNQAQLEPDTGSFRDRDGRIYLHDDRVFRGLSKAALENYQKVIETKFYRKFSKAGLLVNTVEVESLDNPLPINVQQQWAGFLEHERVAVISYPYEWAFSMLKSAALLQLRLTAAAIKEGFTLKDASPYNIQFVGNKPVFIDIASFEALREGEPWSAYRQFCEMFLFPLMLQSYKGVNFQPFMRSRIDGIDVQTAGKLFGFRDRFRKGVFGNVWLQAKLDRRFGGSSENVRSSLKSAGFNRELILVNIRKLKKLITALSWEGDGSEWGDYTSFHNYSDEDHAQKEAFIAHCVEQGEPGTVWDIGCNTGQFSSIAAQHCKQVVATDIDHFAVERLYRNPEIPANVLPLVQNVADPSPNWGWRNLERRDLQFRSQPGMVLCLALIHHVVITANIPLAEFIAWLASVTDQLVIEFVSRDDDKVETLLRNKEDKYWDYRQDYLEEQLGRYFEIREQIGLRDEKRQLYWCQKLASFSDE